MAINAAFCCAFAAMALIKVNTRLMPVPPSNTIPMNNKLFELFGVKNHLELMNYIKNNPDNERVKEVKELLEMFDINIEEGDKNE